MKISVQPDYGNWVSKKRITNTLAAAAAFGIASAALFLFAHGVLAVIAAALLALFAVLALASAWYFVRARKLFSYSGGGVQSKVLELLMNRISWDGKGEALDIGCGSGALAVMLAKKYPEARITGSDYWGGSWGYGEKQCEKNAGIEGVAQRITFIKTSASKLPFADGAFDLAVSNLVFHEVKDSADKREPIREALRVVKKGGAFAFQDLFAMKPYFGTTEELTAFIKSCGVSEVFYEDTSKADIPRALRLPFMIGTLGLVYGTK